MRHKRLISHDDLPRDTTAISVRRQHQHQGDFLYCSIGIKDCFQLRLEMGFWCTPQCLACVYMFRRTRPTECVKFFHGDRSI